MQYSTHLHRFLLQVSAKLVEMGELVLEINGIKVKSSVSMRGIPTSGNDNQTLYVGLGAGLGSVLALIIILTIIQSVVVYLYRRCGVV